MIVIVLANKNFISLTCVFVIQRYVLLEKQKKIEMETLFGSQKILAATTNQILKETIFFTKL